MPKDRTECLWCGEPLHVSKFTQLGRQKFCSASHRTMAHKWQARYPFATLWGRRVAPTHEFDCAAADHNPRRIVRGRNGELSCLACGEVWP
jgi:hypothetical protein